MSLMQFTLFASIQFKVHLSIGSPKWRCWCNKRPNYILELFAASSLFVPISAVLTWNATFQCASDPLDECVSTRSALAHTANAIASSVRDDISPENGAAKSAVTKSLESRVFPWVNLLA